MLRMSGDGVAGIARRLVHRDLPPQKSVFVRFLVAGRVLDEGMALWRPGPHTSTGEDVVELTPHGNPVVVDALLAAAVDGGARLARPGEFTRRAVEHGRLDLVAAEAVDQVVRATSVSGCDVARMALDGRLSACLLDIRHRLLDASAELVARLDWAGDDLADVDDGTLISRLLAVADAADALADTCVAGSRRVEGASVVVVGEANAGKSSLFNALVGTERALVHASPGTTRDVVEARVQLGDLAVTLYDTAGERQTDDPVEALGLAFASRVIEEADLVLLLLAGHVLGPSEVELALMARLASVQPVTAVNRADLGARLVPEHAISVSAATGLGVTTLVACLVDRLIGVAPAIAIASTRQRDLLRCVARGARAATRSLEEAGPAAAGDDLVEAIADLDGMAGFEAREAVLDAVFARFCIGK